MDDHQTFWKFLFRTPECLEPVDIVTVECVERVRAISKFRCSLVLDCFESNFVKNSKNIFEEVHLVSFVQDI